MSEAIVITGMGAVSCLGPDLEAFWDGLVSSRSGIGPIRKFDAAGLRNPEGGEVHDWSTEGLPGWVTALDEAAGFALSAAGQAARQAKLRGDSATGVLLATNFGGARTFEGWAAELAGETLATGDAGAFAATLPPIATNAVAAMLGAAGPRATLSLSCSSGAAAIGMAADWIRMGKARRMIAGGFDALSLYSLAGLSCLRTVTTGKLQSFDKNRSGTVFGEGAGILVLESLSSARERGVEPLAQVGGWAINNNAHHLTAPDSTGHAVLEVMRGACLEARIDPSAIDYVNAHGTGTRYNDPVETAALHSLLGERAFDIPVSSIKPAISHTMGAAGALEAIACAMAIRTGIVPPTLNWSERDPECDLDYVPNEARSHTVSCAISLSSGIGGNNAAIVLEKFAGA